MLTLPSSSPTIDAVCGILLPCLASIMLGQPNLWREKERPWLLAIKNWSPQLFVTCMSTGILAVLLHELPYQFRGLAIISDIYWVLDLILFAFLGSVFILRWILFPSTTVQLFEHDFEATAYLSCTSIALSTLVDLSALIAAKAWSGWNIVSTVLFWIDVAIAFIAAIVPTWVLLRHEHVDLKAMTPSLIYPAIAMTSTAAAGGAVTRYAGLSERLALPIVVVSYLILGLGLFLAILIQAVLMAKLVEHSVPPAKKTPSLFITIGPLSTAGYAFQVLGAVAGSTGNVFAIGGKGPITSLGSVFQGFGILFALLLLGFASFWIIISFIEVLEQFRRSSFSLTTWSSAYPIGVYALTLIEFGIEFDSPAFRTTGTLFTCIVLLQWFYLVARTIPLIISGRLFLEDVEEETTSVERGSDRERSGRAILHGPSPQNGHDKPPEHQA